MDWLERCQAQQRVSVIDWVPNEQIVWAARYGGGLMRSTRYMEIEALGEAGCLFSNGEIFKGLGARWVSKGLRARTRVLQIAPSRSPSLELTRRLRDQRNIRDEWRYRRMA